MWSINETLVSTREDENAQPLSNERSKKQSIVTIPFGSRGGFSSSFPRTIHQVFQIAAFLLLTARTHPHRMRISRPITFALNPLCKPEIAGERSRPSPGISSPFYRRLIPAHTSLCADLSSLPSGSNHPPLFCPLPPQKGRQSTQRTLSCTPGERRETESQNRESSRCGKPTHRVSFG